MPQVDLETLLCGGDIKVACETMIAGEIPPPPKPPEDDPDMPADSIQIPIGGEIDWTDINAVYERDDSTKGNTNPKSHHANQKPQQPLSNSQRFSGNLKPKAPIIALPNKIRNASYVGASARRNPKSSTQQRRKGRAGGDRRSAAQAPEPGSPKVSCFGKVLSERERGKNQRNLAADERVLRSGGCFVRVMEMFRCSGLKSSVEEEEEEEPHRRRGLGDGRKGRRRRRRRRRWWRRRGWGRSGDFLREDGRIRGGGRRRGRCTWRVLRRWIRRG